MKQVIQHEKLGEIVYEEGFWTGKKAISINGAPLEKISKTNFKTADGESASVEGNFLKGVTLYLEGESVRLVPAVKWYEVVMSILPFLLVLIWGNSVALCKIVPVVGGALGGFISALFSIGNLVTIKRIKNICLKILISVVVLGVTFGVCCGLGYALVSALS